MASVVLINPWNFHEENVRYTHERLQHIWRNAPLGIVLLATELRQAGHEVAVCDLERDLVINSGDLEITLAGMRRTLEKLQPDFVGVTVISIRYLEARRIINLCGEIRESAKGPFKIVAGNIHPTSEPELTLMDNPCLDAVFLGEADEPFCTLVSGTPIERVPGVALKQGKIVVRRPRWTASNLDALPFPDWNFVDTGFYAAPNFASHGRWLRPARSLDIICSRGCPYRCTFCVYNKERYRFNSPSYVIANIEYMLDNFDIDSIYFLDSSIGNSRQQLIDICRAITSRGLNSRFQWSANMRPNQVDEELLKLMWEAGCRKLLYGFESGSQRVLDAMKKGCTVEQNDQVVQLHRKLRFPYHASMIMGFPGETKEDLEMTLRWLRSVRPPLVGINTYVPLPGSEDYVRLKMSGRIEVRDPYVWRLVGEVNNRNSPIFSNVSPKVFWEYFEKLNALASELGNDAESSWLREP